MILQRPILFALEGVINYWMPKPGTKEIPFKLVRAFTWMPLLQTHWEWMDRHSDHILNQRQQDCQGPSCQEPQGGTLSRWSAEVPLQLSFLQAGEDIFKIFDLPSVMVIFEKWNILWNMPQKWNPPFCQLTGLSCDSEIATTVGEHRQSCCAHEGTVCAWKLELAAR